MKKYNEEHAIMNSAMIAASKSGDLVFRNNVGHGPVSPPRDRLVAKSRCTVVLERGDVVLRRPSWIKWGLVPGAADIIGIRPTLITKEMVGTILGVFLGLEAKTPKGKQRKDQKTFQRNLGRTGAIYKIVRCDEDVK